MFSFANPEFLYLLVILPVVAGLYLLERWSRKRKLAAFGREEQVRQLMPTVSSRKHIVRLTIILLLLAMAVIILARPRAGAARKSTGNVNGIEVVIAMDVSNSMNASSTSDPQGMSRLQRSKMIMEKLIDRLRSDKVALVVFAGKSYMQMPMTIDGQSAKMFLNGIKTSMVPLQGTAIGSAIDLSMTAFSKDSKASKAIIIITDAENYEDDAVEVLDDTLKKLASTSLSQVTFTKNDEQFPVFAWIALALLIANVLLFNRKNPWLAKHDFFKFKETKNANVE